MNERKIIHAALKTSSYSELELCNVHTLKFELNSKVKTTII